MRAYSSVPLEYLQKPRVIVRGPSSGREYEFSAARPVQPVEAMDVGGLLRTGFFRRPL